MSGPKNSLLYRLSWGKQMIKFRHNVAENLQLICQQGPDYFYERGAIYCHSISGNK